MDGTIPSHDFALPLIVGHRGASKKAPENTLPAFKLAWEQGVDAVEGDFRLTSDGKIVCFHDEDTEKIAGKKITVQDATLDELKTLDVGKWKGAPWKGARIPTLAEVALTVPEGGKLYIEIKCGPEILPVLFDEIEKSDLDDEQIVIVSFNEEVIRRLKVKKPNWKALWLAVYDKKDQPVLSGKKVLDLLESIRADGISTNASERIEESFVKSIAENGYEYHVWTIDDPAVAERFIALGALSITTNVPDLLIESLSE